MERDVIERWHWDYAPKGNVEHIAKKGVTPEDVEEVYNLEPRFIPGKNDATMMLGQNHSGRYLAAIIYPTFEPGMWVAATAYWMERPRAERLYRRDI